MMNRKDEEMVRIAKGFILKAMERLDEVESKEKVDDLLDILCEALEEVEEMLKK